MVRFNMGWCAAITLWTLSIHEWGWAALNAVCLIFNLALLIAEGLCNED